MGTPEGPDTDKLVRIFLKMRNARAVLSKTYTEQDEELKTNMKTVEIELLRRAQEQGVEGFKTKDGTTYIAEEVHASIEDYDTFTTFLEEPECEDPYAFYEQRPSLKRIKEYQADHDGAAPPGIRLFRENRMRVRASKNGEDK
jgi:hypothetical protein